MKQKFVRGGVFSKNKLNTKLETLKKDNKNKIVIGLLILTSLILVVTLVVSRARYIYTDKIELVNGSITIGEYDFKIKKIYYQNGLCSEDNCYDEKSVMPSAGYTINEQKSYCYLTDEATHEEVVLKTNEAGEHIIGNVQKNSKCVLYFDAIEGFYGTESNPYIINSINDLVNLSTNVNAGNSYEGMYFKLEKDINFQKDENYEDKSIKNAQISGSGFIPIGTDSNPFKGTFDGNNKRIDNLYINNKTLERIGLFGKATAGTIKNLTVSGNITSTVLSDVGGIVAIGSDMTIEKCINEVNLYHDHNEWSTGGLIAGAWNIVTIIDSINKGTISGGAQAGGLVGAGSSGIKELTIKNSHNEGKIINNIGSNAGGLIGSTYGVNGINKIIGSYNTGQIIADNNSNSLNIGGLVGNVTNEITIEDSYSTQDDSIDYGINVISNQDIVTRVGGLIGIMESTAIVTINNSHNDANIKIKNDVNQTSYLIGGIVGISRAKLIMTETYNAGNVEGGVRTGGLIGRVESKKKDTIINKCYNKGRVESSAYGKYGMDIGGLMGSINVDCNVYIINSYNIGNIVTNLTSGSNKAGGLVAVYDDSNPATDNYQFFVINSTNLGNISANSSTIGGITSGKLNVTLNNVYSAGDIISTDSSSILYGIGELNLNSSTINKTYYKNDSGILGSNITDNEIIGISSTDMKDKAFTDTLNSNLNNINLSEIFKDASAEVKEIIAKIELVDWIQGEDGYPILKAS